MHSNRTFLVVVLLFIIPSNAAVRHQTLENIIRNETFFKTSHNETARAEPPEFLTPLVNMTVPMGRDAMFGCHVKNLGGYRVGWVKADTKAIQAIHHNVITHNERVSVSHINQITWNLHIRGVQEEDGGIYMCQINTDPMLSQIGILKVVVSPDFIQDETSGDEIIREGTHLFLTCKASGRPAPRIEWRREDGSDIIIRNGSTRIKVPTVEGSTLNMTKILRSEMGVYMCIASNGVPPAVSKRIQVSVTFPPVINVRNQLVGAPLGTSVTLECTVEAFPKPIYYWVAKPDHMLLSNDRLDIGEQEISSFETRMYITVKNFVRRDVGSYRCISKNSLGLVESSVRLYEITGPTLVSRFADEDDDSEYFGSAENEAEEQLINSVAGRGRSPSLQRTLKAPRATRNSYTDKQVPSEGGTPYCITITVIVTIFPLLIFNLFLI